MQYKQPNEGLGIAVFALVFDNKDTLTDPNLWGRDSHRREAIDTTTEPATDMSTDSDVEMPNEEVP
jgi:hypothetical protein